ncbi:Stk1 family PASTA domain-containing Ser/Thr kinase [Lawsonibacter celer]|uniref:Stk1 family PASTA domain-containing Ser/Thr kinase n=1 Tax=Lawsonibacter celer TaxID=2986526 RepID=UPI001646DC08|nr:Stk1 family PASTA domain-containing Ser/Thr kinase [Lawsonibacter celer]
MDQYIGKLLDNRYEILERIGTGGMAVVYKARCHWLNRLVAVKILKEDLAQDAEIRRRFHDESQAVAMLSHPNIVAVYDVSRTSDPDYIVMELIDGITLKQYIQKKGGKLSWREALHFTTQIMKALSHAHGRGIIHRDIKPHNMMVLRDGSLKVADFGIARVASAAQATLTQEALGSVHYISPEQARGSHIDARSDIYSAGVVLYEMITGRLPYEGDSPVSVAIQHINSIPLSPRDLDPDIPEALEAITMKAMASDVNRRYVSADAMLADLEEFRKNPSISFDYTSADLLAEEGDEPTQILGANTPHSVRQQPAHADRVEEPTQAAHPRRSHSRRNDVGVEEEYEPHGRRGGASRLPLFLAVGAIAVFLVGIGVFLWVSFFSGMVGGEQQYNVPKLIGMTLEEARANEAVLKGQFVVVEGETVVSDAPAGQIVSQTPDSGLNAPSGATITVSVSSGSEASRMPDLYNKDHRVAVSTLKNLGITEDNITIEERSDESVGEGKVISQTPAAETDLAGVTQVTLVVSTGPKVETVNVVSFLHKSPEDAQKWAEEQLSLTYGGITGQEYSDDVDEGLICWQSIEPGTEVDEGTTIYFKISKGSDPASSTPPTDEPTVSPTPSQSPGTGEDPAPSPIPVYRTVQVKLPNDGRERVAVRIQVGDNTAAYDNMAETQMGTIYAPVQGIGVQQVTIYIDEVSVDSYTLDFSQ